MWLIAALACTAGGDDTGDAEAYSQPLTFEVSGAYAYDPVNDQARSYAIADAAAPLQPWMEFAFVVEKPDGTLEDCFVALNHRPENGPIDRAPWATGDFGVDLPETAAAGGSCRNWDPAVWGDNPALTIAETTWGLGVAALDPSVAPVVSADVEPELWEEHWQPYLIGGTFHPDLGVAYGFAYEVNDAFEVEYVPSDGFHDVIADAVAIEAERVVPGEPLPRGLYLVKGLGPIDIGVLEP